MALEYAKKYRDYVSHVIMIGISPIFNDEAKSKAEQYWEESVDPVRKAVVAENLLRVPDDQLAQLSPPDQFLKSYVRNGPRIWNDPRYDATDLLQGFSPNMIGLKIWSEDFAAIDITKGLNDFSIPVFIALGRYYFLVAPPSSWDPVRSEFQDLTLRVFEQSGHTPQYEEAGLFDAELLSWMNDRQSPMSALK